jgi:hypothetical protein
VDAAQDAASTTQREEQGDTAVEAPRTGWARTRIGQCPKCGEDRLVERVGAVWFCNVCSYSWQVREDGVPDAETGTWSKSL